VRTFVVCLDKDLALLVWGTLLKACSQGAQHTHLVPGLETVNNLISSSSIAIVIIVIVIMIIIIFFFTLLEAVRSISQARRGLGVTLEATPTIISCTSIAWGAGYVGGRLQLIVVCVPLSPYSV
jgi:hypothetical protein